MPADYPLRIEADVLVQQIDVAAQQQPDGNQQGQRHTDLRSDQITAQPGAAEAAGQAAAALLDLLDEPRRIRDPNTRNQRDYYGARKRDEYRETPNRSI